MSTDDKTSRPALFVLLFLIGFSVSMLLKHSIPRPGSESDTPIPPSEARRIICMAPNITETVFALGCGDRVVGVTDFTDYPPAAKNIARVGGYIDPNFERLTALEPDLIFLQGEHQQVTEFCRRRGIHSVSVDMDDLESIYSGIRTIGEALGKESESGNLVQTIQKDLADIKGRVPADKRLRVFLSLGRKIGSLAGLYTTGNSGFIGELLTVAGGDNIFAELKDFYPQISKESLVKRQPELIIDAFPGQSLSTENREQALADWQALSSLPAVETGNIKVLTEDFLVIPGPRIAKSARLLNKVLFDRR